MALKGNKKGIGLKYALSGLKVVFKKERNFKIHLIALLIVITTGIFFKLTYIEWAIVLIVSSLVILTEVINSVIELMIDYMKPEIHPTAKEIKDMSASVVLIATMTAVIIGFIIFFRKILLLI